LGQLLFDFKRATCACKNSYRITYHEKSSRMPQKSQKTSIKITNFKT